jgi:hypothetical protein
MVVERAAAADVMREFTINRQRVYFLVRRVTRWAKQHEGVGDVLALKVQSTIRLGELYRSVLKQWERSCQDAKTHSIVTVEGAATTYEGSIIRLPDKKTTRVQTRGQAGDPSLVRELRGLEADIRGIWGADAPKQFQGTVEEKTTLAVILARAERSAPPPTEETGNVIDVDAELVKIRGEHGQG